MKLYTLYYRYLPDGKVTKVTIDVIDPLDSVEKTVDVIGGLTYNFSVSATTVEEGPRSSTLRNIREYGKI